MRPSVSVRPHVRPPWRSCQCTLLRPYGTPRRSPNLRRQVRPAMLAGSAVAVMQGPQSRVLERKAAQSHPALREFIRAPSASRAAVVAPSSTTRQVKLPTWLKYELSEKLSSNEMWKSCGDCLLKALSIMLCGGLSGTWSARLIAISIKNAKQSHLWYVVVLGR